MKLANYSPTSRQVLYKAVAEEEVRESGLIMPAPGTSLKTFATMFENEKVHSVDRPATLVVLKVGPACVEVKPGDKITIAPGFQGTKLVFDDYEEFYSIMEMNIIGYEREPQDGTNG